MIGFSIVFSIVVMLRIFFGIFVDKVSWFKPFITPLTGLCIFFGAVAILLIIVDIISKLNKK